MSESQQDMDALGTREGIAPPSTGGGDGREGNAPPPIAADSREGIAPPPTGGGDGREGNSPPPVAADSREGIAPPSTGGGDGRGGGPTPTPPPAYRIRWRLSHHARGTTPRA